MTYHAYVSGGSANPNVSLMFCLLGKMEWKRLPVYVIAEFVGAFLAAALTYSIYHGQYRMLSVFK